MNQHAHQTPTKIAFIQARWHSDIVDQSRLSFIDEVRERTQDTAPNTATIEVFDVPGAYEIPLLAKMLAKTGNYAAVVGSALVVDGGIYRHDFVADAVVSGLMQVQIETEVPMFSAVLTPHQFHEIAEHRAFFTEHFKTKGREAAEACLSVLETHRKLAA
ncbi:MAG: 6,7-dimethyl-8-ribityllumazine synthase [Rhodospirillaceae bacterium]|jgi:6,7-dimethyl-8-ribityllumazine synthase|nr:6,7-dimethyl-8-ribityllumazine synthase [Rhodospirillaceae bacterium]